jgi:hypothetical protein
MGPTRSLYASRDSMQACSKQVCSKQDEPLGTLHERLDQEADLFSRLRQRGDDVRCLGTTDAPLLFAQFALCVPQPHDHALHTGLNRKLNSTASVKGTSTPLAR